MKKKLFRFLTILLFLTVLFILGCNIWINFRHQNLLYEDIKKIPFNQVGMVLGTSKYLKNRKPNPYFFYRLEAAIKLYKAKKIEIILVSGDNRKVNYNEPKQMTLYLLKKGIPENKIVQDYGGRRTLDSVIRGNLIFDLSKFTIISQEFHNERAVFIAKHYDLEVVAFNAKAVSYNSILSLKNEWRECLARVKAVIDILLQVQPAIGGKKEPILVLGHQ
jgi:SanA protein